MKTYAMKTCAKKFNAQRAAKAADHVHSGGKSHDRCPTVSKSSFGPSHPLGVLKAISLDLVLYLRERRRAPQCGLAGHQYGGFQHRR